MGRDAACVKSEVLIVKTNHNTKNIFAWTAFYTEFADRLLLYKEKRPELLILFKGAFASLRMKYPFMDNGEPVDDICPLTVFGCFNKGISDATRISLISAIGGKLGVQTEAPSKFDGIPVLNNMRAWFFRYKSRS